jgi:DNA-binding NarL/FixJ family response regulator
LLKNSEPEEVAQAVRDVAGGGAALPPALASQVLAEFGRLAHSATGREALYRRLTRQETEVLKHLARRLTNEQICREMFLEMTTVKKHVGNILKKLEVNDRQGAAHIARELGF